MGVDEIALLLPHLGDHGLGLGVAAAAGGKGLVQLLLHLLADLVAPLGGQGGHVLLHRHIVPLGELEEHPLQVGGDEDVHGGGHGVVEGAVPVVHAGLDEIGEDVVLIGGADELVDGYAHLLGIVGREDVAEIARGDADVDWLPLLHAARLQKVAVGRDVIDDLGQDAAPVDGVGGGEEVPPAGQGVPEGAVGEEPLHAGLGVVKVAHHGADSHVVPLLGLHLELLDIGDPVLGVEHQDAGPVHVLEALQGGLAGVAGGGHQDADRLLLLVLSQGGREEMGQHLESHVLEGAGGAVPELQAVGLVVQLPDGRHLFDVEFVGTVGPLGKAGELGGREVVQIGPHHEHSPLLVGHIGHGLESVGGELGQHLRRQQSAVQGQALGNGLGRAAFLVLVSCAYILHTSFTTLIKLE